MFISLALAAENNLPPRSLISPRSVDNIEARHQLQVCLQTRPVWSTCGSGCESVAELTLHLSDCQRKQNVKWDAAARQPKKIKCATLGLRSAWFNKLWSWAKLLFSILRNYIKCFRDLKHVSHFCVQIINNLTVNIHKLTHWNNSVCFILCYVTVCIFNKLNKSIIF